MKLQPSKSFLNLNKASMSGFESMANGFQSSRSIKRLNETVLDSYQVIDKIDTSTIERAEKHSKRVNSHLNKIKSDLIKTHIHILKKQNAKKDGRKHGIDVEAIPEKGGDDPFGLIDKASNNDSFG